MFEGVVFGLFGVVVFVVQIAILLYVLSLLRRTAEGVEHIGSVLERSLLERASPGARSTRLGAEQPVTWVGNPVEVGEGRWVVPGDEGVVVDHGDELTVAFYGVTFTCAVTDVEPRRT